MAQRLMMVAICALSSAALTLDAAAAKPASGLLKGRTAQDRAIRLAARSGSVQLKRFTIELRCHPGILIDVESDFQPTPLTAGGHLRDHQSGTTDDVWLRGRLQGRRLDGMIRVRDRLGKVRCDSGWVRFHATAAGGRH